VVPRDEHDDGGEQYRRRVERQEDRARDRPNDDEQPELPGASEPEACESLGERREHPRLGGELRHDGDRDGERQDGPHPVGDREGVLRGQQPREQRDAADDEEARPEIAMRTGEFSRLRSPLADCGGRS
jgi:hypothetical protein